MILSVITLLVVLLIAYWWGNAGVFDALLHLLCVIVAGALAVALWEPVTVGFMLDGGFGEYAWGVTLGGMFVLLLLICRLIVDAACPFRPKVSRMLDWSVGSLLGLCSGVLTMGLVLISIGHIASTRELLGYQGWIRDPGSDAPKQSESGAPATLMMNAAAGFYGWLSDASLAPIVGNASLARWRPDIAADGGSLLRDSIEGGKGRLSTPSNGVSVVSAHYDPSFALKSGGSGAYAVLVSLKRPGYDKGAGFTMSASQARLIDGNTGSSVFPAEFAQAEQSAGDSLVRYRFSGDGSYLGSTASSEESLACLLFPATGLKRSKDGPLFLQIKGLRIQLPTPQTDAAEMARAVSSGGKQVQIAADADTPVVPASELRLDTGLQGAMIDRNGMPGSLTEDNGKLTGGAATHITRGQNAKGDVRGFFEPNGQRMVMLKCSRDTAVDLFNVNRTRKDAEKVGMNGEPVLVDDKNNIYAPCGYLWKDDVKNEFEIYLEPPEEGFTINRFRRAANSGELQIMYRIPNGVTIKLVVLRDPNKSIGEGRVVGTANLTVEAGAPSR